MTEAWCSIYQGNGRDLEAQAKSFMDKYRPHIFKRESPVVLGNVDPERLMRVCVQAKKSAPGTDAWTPAEFAMLPQNAYAWLAKLLDMVESGRPWPQDLQHAKAAFMEKDAGNNHDPLAYRVLQVLPVLYRRWATMRLADLEAWAKEWQMEGMYAGVPGKGALDGAYEAALTIEFCRITGTQVTGGASDIYKCFDQVNRHLVYGILEEAGCPKGVITAYRAFQESVAVHNAVAGGYGRGYSKRCSIP